MSALQHAVAVGRSLSTVSERDPEQIRRRAVQALYSVVEAENAGFYSLAWIEGRCRLVNPVCEGDACGHELIKKLTGPDSTEILNERLYQSTITRPIANATSSFLDESSSLNWPKFEQGKMYKKAWGPLNLRHQLRVLIFDGRRFVGWFGLLRSKHSQPFTRWDRRRLKPLLQPSINRLLLADRLERAATPIEAGDLVVDGQGRVEYASGRGTEWLSCDGIRPALVKLVQAVDRRGLHEKSEAARYAAARILRLDGDGKVRYLVNLSSPTPVSAAPDSLLSARQREVATIAARGATLHEIASALSLSVETVRSHLRESYRRLDVTTRLELAQVLSGARDGPGPGEQSV